MNKFELSYNNTVLPNTALQSHLLTFPVFLVWMSAVHTVTKETAHPHPIVFWGAINVPKTCYSVFSVSSFVFSTCFDVFTVRAKGLK